MLTVRELRGRWCFVDIESGKYISITRPSRGLQNLMAEADGNKNTRCSTRREVVDTVHGHRSRTLSEDIAALSSIPSIILIMEPGGLPVTSMVEVGVNGLDIAGTGTVTQRTVH